MQVEVPCYFYSALASLWLTEAEVFMSLRNHSLVIMAVIKPHLQ